MKENQLDSSLKLLAKSSVIVLFGLLASKILFYTYRIIIARQFGPEMYGFFSLSLIAVGWLVAFSSFGLADGCLRFIAFYRGKKEINKIKYILRITLSVSIVSSILAAIFLFFASTWISVSFFHNPSLSIFLKIFSILIPLSVISGIFLSVLKAYEKIALYSGLMNILQNVVKLVFLILLALLGLKTSAVIFSYVSGALILLVAAYLACRYKISEVFGKNNLNSQEKSSVYSELFSYSWPLLLTGIVSNIFPWIDSFIIGYFKDVTAVGLYNAAVPLAMLLNTASDIFLQLFFPMISREFSRKNFKLIKELSQQVGKWIFMINFPVLIIMILFPGAILNLFFGQEYLVVAIPLSLLSIGVFLSALSMISEFLIIISGRTKLSLVNLVLASVLNAVLNILLVPKYGLNGAALSTSIALISLGIARMVEAYYFMGITPLKKEMFRIFLVSIIPASILLVITNLVKINTLSMIVLGLLFFLVYIFLLFLTHCLDKNDFMIMRSIKRKIIPGYAPLPSNT